jgi:hypothetical protein
MRKKIFKIISLLLAVISVCSFTACNNEDDGGQTPSTISVNAAQNVASTTATLSAVINLSTNELYKSDFGFLYVSEAELPSDMSADLLFSDFASNGILTAGTKKPVVNIEQGGIISQRIEGLSDQSKYYYSAYVITPNGKCHVSSSLSFTTEQYSPVVNSGEAKSINFYSAVLSGSVEMSDADLSSSTYGIIVSKTSGKGYPGEKNVVCKNNNTNFSLKINGLSIGTTYYYRTYSTADGKRYVYGEEKSFTTKSTDDMIVDLGLSVKWASCNLGADIPDDFGNYYQWGCVEPNLTGDKFEYPYYEKFTNSYVDIGENKNICGTEYDAATLLLGEGWRLPTKDELQELLDKCIIETYHHPENKMRGFVVKSENGNSIYLPSAGCISSGHSSAYVENSMSMVILQLGIPSGTGDKENLGSFNCLLLRIFDGTKKQEVSLDVKHIAYPIRPVYDPK